MGGDASKPRSNITRIDLNLAAPGFKEVAKGFKCQMCQFIPLSPVQCWKCDKMICRECFQTIEGKKCPQCNIILSDKLISESLKKYLDLINVKCSRGCEYVGELKDLDSHLTNCTFTTSSVVAYVSKPTIKPEPIVTTQKDVNILSKSTTQTQNNNFQVNNIYIRPEPITKNEVTVFKQKLLEERELSKAELKNDKIIKSLDKSYLEKFTKEQLSYILEIRCRAFSGQNKAILIDRIKQHFEEIEFDNKKLKRLIASGQIEDMSNEGLDEELSVRLISKGKNKSEKIENLRKYLVEN